MKFFKINGIIILLIFIISIITACDTAIVETEESEKIEEKTELPKEEIKETPKVEEGSKQEVLTENIKTQSSSGEKNEAPKILITEPDGGDVVTNSPFTLGWRAEDSNNDRLLIKLEYQKDGDWILIEDNLVHTGRFGTYDWNLGALSNGGYSIRATITDGISSASDNKGFTIER